MTPISTPEREAAPMTAPSSTVDAPELTVTTWGDGFGRWCVRVSGVTNDYERMHDAAHAAVLTQMDIRGERVAPWEPRLSIVQLDTKIVGADRDEVELTIVWRE